MSISSLIGRPRDASRDIAIEKAAIELLREVGYERISIEAVAHRAQVSKTTIYRRWKNKAELVADAVHHYAFCQALTFNTGSLRGDLIEIVSQAVKTMKSEDGQLIAGLMAAARKDEDLSGILVQSMAERPSLAHAEIFARAIERGELPAKTKSERIWELIPAVISFRLFMSHQSISKKFIENFVDEVLVPVLIHSSK